MSRGHRNDKRVARRVRHDMELAQRKRDDKLTRRILDAVAKAPLSDAQLAQVRAALVETGENGEGRRETMLEWDPSSTSATSVPDGPAPSREWRKAKAVDVLTELGGEVVETRPEAPAPGTLAGIYPAVSTPPEYFRVPGAFKAPPEARR